MQETSRNACAQVLDDLLLLAIHPARHDEDHELQSVRHGWEGIRSADAGPKSAGPTLRIFRSGRQI